MDLVWEYEHAYGELVPERHSWARFMSGVAHTARFTARQLYAAIAGPSFALAGLSDEGMGERAQVSHYLEATAFGQRTVLRAPPRRSLILGPDGEAAR